MDTLLLQPAPGLVVRDPDTRLPLAAEGENKPASTYWHRRLAEGSVVLVTPPAAAAPKTASKPA